MIISLADAKALKDTYDPALWFIGESIDGECSYCHKYCWQPWLAMLF